MPDKTMLFGTQYRVQEVTCPASGMGMNTVRWRDTRTFLNGGAAQRSSLTGHKEYSMSWGPFAQSKADELLNFFNGLYGPGPFYFADPFAVDKNLLPGYIAAPAVGATDGYTMVTGVTPTVAVTSALGAHPINTTTYAVTTGAKNIFFRGLVPTGHRVLVGWNGSRTADASLQVGIGYSPSSWTTITPTTADTTRYTGSIANSLSEPTFFSLRWNGGSTSGSFTVRSIQVITVPNDGAAYPAGTFVSGKGTSGVQLLSDPQITGYSAVIANANIGLSADFVEVGSWS